jgi:hypothetical protein
MSKLTAAEQKEYEEEAEYADQQRTGRQPRPSAMERIRGAVTSGARAVRDAANSPAMREWAARSNSTQGINGYEPPAAMQRMRQPRAGVEVNQGSSIHPGTRILVVEGSVLASARAPGTAPQGSRAKRPSWQTGGLGDEDHGL